MTQTLDTQSFSDCDILFWVEDTIAKLKVGDFDK